MKYKDLMKMKESSKDYFKVFPKGEKKKKSIWNELEIEETNRG